MIAHTPGLVPDELRFFEALPDNYLVLSPQLLVISASDAYLKISGLNRQDIIDCPVSQVYEKILRYPAEYNSEIAQSFQKVLQTGESHLIPKLHVDFVAFGNQEQGHFWKILNKPVLNASGQLNYIIHRIEDITAQISKEEELQHSLKKGNLLGEQMEKLFHDIPAQIAIVRGPDLVYDYINPQYQRELFPGRDVLGLPLLAALPEIKSQPIWDILHHVYKTGETVIENELLIPLAGEKGGPVSDHYFNLVYQPLRNEDGDIYALLSFKYEVTSHVAARKKLEANEMKLRFANNQLAQTVEELQTIQEELAASNEELTVSNEELQLTQESLQKLNEVLEQRVSVRTRELADSVEEQQSINEELTATNDELRATHELLALTNNRLAESEQRFRNLIRESSVGIIMLHGKEMRVDIVNDAYGLLIGRTAVELDGKFLFDVIPDAESFFRPIIDGVRLSGEAVYLYETPYQVKKDGQVINGFINVVYQPYREADGRISGVMALVHNVSDQVTARTALESNRVELENINEQLNAHANHLRMAIAATGLGTWEYNVTSGKLYWSPECRLIYGLPDDEEPTMETFTAHIFVDDRIRVEEEISRALSRSNGRYEIVYRINRFDNDEVRWIKVQGTVFFNEAGIAQRFIGAVIDITTSILAEEESAKLAAIITSSDDAIISKTLDGVITSWNNAAERMFGYTASEIIGKSIYTLIPPDREGEEPPILSRLKRGERVEHFETRRMSKDGRLIEVSLTISPVKDSEGRVIGISKIARDITEKKQEDSRKIDFIGMVSHELKTPLTSLNAILQVADIKLRKSDDAFLSAAIAKANYQVKRMSAMINGFLNVSRLESGNIVIEKRWFDICQMIHDVIEETKLTISNHTIIFHKKVDINVFADADKINSVLTNLISNAVKYSPKGKNIYVSCEEESGVVTVNIKDEGMGIKPDDQAKIFDRYYRVSSPHTKHISGFGIGLYLSAEIIKKHHGNISVKSENGNGATFTFTLPPVTS